MTFKEQMREKADELYPKRIYIDSFDEYQDTNIKERTIWLSGAEFASQAALKSDLVKGLVEALEKALPAFGPDNLSLSAYYEMITTALTNFKQAVKQ